MALAFILKEIAKNVAIRTGSDVVRERVIPNLKRKISEFSDKKEKESEVDTVSDTVTDSESKTVYEVRWEEG